MLDEVFTIVPRFQTTTRRRSSVRSADSASSMRQKIGISASIEIDANKSAAYDWLNEHLSDFYEVERDGVVDLLSNLVSLATRLGSAIRQYGHNRAARRIE